MKWLIRSFLVLLVLALGAVGWWLFAAHRGDASLAQTGQLTAGENLSDPALIERGKYLATVGDCAACHTQRGGAPFAGGHEVPTPFGNIPTPNITPDDETGLGRWSFADFWQALHTGKGRHGEFLYPAFSYTSYTKVTRDDALAMFAYLKSLAPVRQPAKALGLKFPYSVRSGLAAWRTLYFREGVYQPDPAKSAEWNRGAYLVQGLGHCNECHVARDALGGVPDQPALSGGQIPAQDWYAPDLSTQAHGGLHGWSRQDIVDLLKTGQSAKGSAFGPMAEVVSRSTQHMTDADLAAVATYLESLPARAQPVVVASAIDNTTLMKHGNEIYDHQCAACHGKDGNGVPGVYPPLNGNSSVDEPTGINAVRVVLLGGFPPVTAGNPRPYSMPPFAQSLKDADVAAVVSYIRQAWGNHAGPVLERDVGKYRQTPID
ncbi:MAG: c-type cytochrome [Dyella sp.]|uniref:c-type cytochrome n=1 Tax=Dyella sp. TaxID=1869338 RepID=UPI003F8009EF